MAYEGELRFARQVCARAARIQMSAARRLHRVTIKSDRSPVTEVDTRSQRLIVDAIDGAFPADGILAEEGGCREGTSGRRWVIDPLDGTRPYIRGIPTFSVLLALEERGAPVVGVIHMPELGVECWGRRGGGAFVNGARARVSTTGSLGSAMGSALGFVERRDRASTRLLALMRRWDYAYGFMDAYTYVAVIAGKLDACVNLLDKPWDCAAAACIVTEAGGRYSDIRGARTVHTGSFVISNGRLHGALLRQMGARPNKRSART
jgi:histidinol-phosphatase